MSSELPLVCAVTGGGGYVGKHMCDRLLSRGFRVCLCDVSFPLADSLASSRVSLNKVDIRNGDELEHALAGASCVVHLASYGMSGREQLNRSLIHAVNVEGTETVLRVCQKLSIPRLVYTSTFNVVFGGQEIKNGDESLPLFPLEQHCDEYSRSKAMAETLVLAANGTRLKNGGTLRTCALRLAGIYGPGEQRHFPRIVSYIERGYFRMLYGQPDSLVQFVHIDNVVQAHVLAAEALGEERRCIAAGQAYFISDGEPVNNFEFLRPLVEQLGYPFPRLRLPLMLVYYIAFMIELVHWLVGRIYNFQPLLTRAEVWKTGRTHYFSICKAQEQLGYAPTVVNDLSGVIQDYRDRARKPTKTSRWRRFIVDLTIAFLFACALLSFLPVVR